MRHVIVTRIVVSLVALCVAAVALFAWAVTRPELRDADVSAKTTGPGGAELFSRHCATCHEDEAAEISLDYREAADRDAAIAELRDFLVEHHGPSPEGISLIVDHLLGRDDP